MTNFNLILDYARLIGNLKEVINKEEYTVASNICEELAKRKIGITDEYLNNAEEECNKILAIVKDIRGTRLAAKADLNNITDADGQAFYNKIKEAKVIKAVVPDAGSDYDIDKEANNIIYYHLIIEGNSYRFGAGRIGTTFDNSVYCSASEEDFIDSCCQILLNKGIIANITEELNAVVGGAKKFIEYTKKVNSSRVESSSPYRTVDKGMKENCGD